VSDKPPGLLPQSTHTTELEICNHEVLCKIPKKTKKRKTERRRRENNERGERKTAFLVRFGVSTQSPLPCINVTSGSFPTHQATRVF
jgi:hypothetical protein